MELIDFIVRFDMSKIAGSFKKRLRFGGDEGEEQGWIWLSLGKDSRKFRGM